MVFTNSVEPDQASDQGLNCLQIVQLFLFSYISILQPDISKIKIRPFDYIDIYANL